MALNYAYNYAYVDPTTHQCLGVYTSDSAEYDASCFVPIPVYDPEYGFKYYINGNWYEDAAGTIPWTSSLL